MKKLFIIISLLFLSAIPTMAQAAAGFTKVANVSTLTYVDSSCPDLSTCYYQVTALDAQGFESGPAACASTQLCQNGNMAVAIMPSSGVHTVTLTWSASATASVTYNVYRHIGPLSPSGLGAVVN
jgi:hypothetical protein